MLLMQLMTSYRLHRNGTAYYSYSWLTSAFSPAHLIALWQFDAVDEATAFMVGTSIG